MRFFSYKDISEIAKNIRLKHSLESGRHYVVAIDGRAASGKTTLAQSLSRELDNCTVFHTDDYFLPQNMRTEKRLNEPGGNFDRERFIREIILPLKSLRPVKYRKFMCKSMTYSPCIDVLPTGIVIIEGAYCMHPDVCKTGVYSLYIFSDAEMNDQIKRINERDGEAKLQLFSEKWIPMEEEYFRTFSIKNQADCIYKICPPF